MPVLTISVQEEFELRTFHCGDVIMAICIQAFECTHHAIFGSPSSLQKKGLLTIGLSPCSTHDGCQTGSTCLRMHTMNGVHTFGTLG